MKNKKKISLLALVFFSLKTALLSNVENPDKVIVNIVNSDSSIPIIERKDDFIEVVDTDKNSLYKVEKLHEVEKVEKKGVEEEKIVVPKKIKQEENKKIIKKQKQVQDQKNLKIAPKNKKEVKKNQDKIVKEIEQKEKVGSVEERIPSGVNIINKSGIDGYTDIVIPQKSSTKSEGFHNTRISLSNEMQYRTNYSGKSNLKGNFSDDNFINDKIEFYTEKDTIGYTAFIGKREEGEYYNGDVNLDEIYYGGRLTKFFPGRGFLYGGLKYYQGESDGYFNEYHDYIDRDETLTQNKLRWEVGGYLDTSPYFISGYYGGDSPSGDNGLYESGNYMGAEIGKNIPYKNDYIIPSLEYYGEDYESYSFEEVWAKLGYQHNYDKWYITPFVAISLFKNRDGSNGNNGDYDTNPGGKYRVGVKGNHQLHENLGVTYGVFWQNETRDYNSGSGTSDTLWSYVSLDYYF